MSREMKHYTYMIMPPQTDADLCEYIVYIMNIFG